MTHALPSVRHLFSSALLHVRAHGRGALRPLFGFSLLMAAQVAGLVLTVLRFGTFSETVDPSAALAMGLIGIPLMLTLVLTALCNWAWVACWARGAGRHPAFKTVAARVIGLYILYKVVAGVPGLLFGATGGDALEGAVQAAAMVWVLIVLSRGVPALAYVARDGMGVFAAVNKSVAVTKAVWLGVLWRLTVGWAALTATVVVLVALGVAAKLYLPLPDGAALGVGIVLVIAFAQALLLLSLSFVMRLAEGIAR